MNNTFRIKSAKKNDQKYLFFKTHTKLNNKFILPGLRKEKTEIKLDNDIYFLGSNSKGKDRKNMTQKLKLKSDIFTSVNKEKIIIDDLRKNLDREIEKNKVLKKKLENKDFEIKDLKNKLTNQEKENNKLIDELHEVYVKYDRLKRFVSGESGVYIEVEDKLKEEIENHNKIVEEFAQKLGKQTFENEALTKQVKKFKVLNSNLDGALNATIKENDDFKKNINFLEFELNDKKNENIILEKENKKYALLNDEMDKTCDYLIRENKKLKNELKTKMNNNVNNN